jgi:hypothetical protein
MGEWRNGRPGGLMTGEMLPMGVDEEKMRRGRDVDFGGSASLLWECLERAVDCATGAPRGGSLRTQILKEGGYSCSS